MKAVIKCGDDHSLADKIERFFLANILPGLNFGIAIEKSKNSILVYTKENHQTNSYVDPTVEIIVELRTGAIDMALDKNASEEALQKISDNFFDEAKAIRKIEKINPFFSREYYSCRYAEGSHPKK